MAWCSVKGQGQLYLYHHHHNHDHYQTLKELVHCCLVPAHNFLKAPLAIVLYIPLLITV
jgi:hypothetical protein